MLKTVSLLTILLLFSSVGFLLTSCGEELIEISDSQRPVLEEGDTLIFRSASGAVDSLRVGSIAEFIESRSGSLFDNRRIEFIEYRYYKMRSNIQFLFVTQSRQASAARGEGAHYLLAERLEEFQLNGGEIVNGVARFEWDTRLQHDQAVLDVIFYNAQLGVVGYHYVQGDTFRLDLP